MIDIEFEHNHSLENLEATNFCDISSDCVDKIYKLYERGHTPSTARQYLKEIREACTNDLEFHKKKVDRSVVPRRRDFNYLYTQFGNERFGGRGVMMFSLKQGFEMLRSCLPDFAFHGRGPQLGPQVIITDNCKEERNTLKSVWPSTILLLCIFHVLQQLWRWLHENSHNINQADRPHILGLFKQCFICRDRGTV